jgi:hypothetical protein
VTTVRWGQIKPSQVLRRVAGGAKPNRQPGAKSEGHLRAWG